MEFGEVGLVEVRPREWERLGLNLEGMLDSLAT